MNILENVSLLPYNTFGINVRTKYFAHYQSVEQLRQLLESDILKREKLLHIGGGSNLLFVSDFEGIVLHSEMKFIEKMAETDSEILLRVGSGVIWDNFVDYCVMNNYCGTENLSLIPGETGAAAVQNIGAYGMEVSDIIQTLETVDIQTLEEQIFTNCQCKYGYRTSIFKTALKGKKIVTAVVFKLSKKGNFNLSYANLEQEILKSHSQINLSSIRATVISIRESKLPNPEITGNAGSFFKNPYISINHYDVLKKSFQNIPYYAVNKETVKIPAAWLIEQCGWKGKVLAGAAVNATQPLILVNKGKATGAEILALADKIQRSVKEKFEINLEMEVEIV